MTDKSRRKIRSQSLWELFLENGQVFLLVLLVLTNLFVLCPMQTEGTSMEPTIHSGSWILLKKAGAEKKRNRMVVAWSGSLIVKRIVGLPGETIEIGRDGSIRIDGALYENRFQSAALPGAAYTERRIHLGSDEYFLLGDNRPASCDSRTFGPVRGKNICGEVIWIGDGAKDPYGTGGDGSPGRPETTGQDNGQG